MSIVEGKVTSNCQNIAFSDCYTFIVENIEKWKSKDDTAEE
jgi:hypothetical protein